MSELAAAGLAREIVDRAQFHLTFGSNRQFGLVVAGIMWIICMYQMLILSRNKKLYGNAWQADLEP